MDFTEKIVRNTTYNIIGGLWTRLVGFLLTPYILNQIGVKRFGIWSVVFLIIGYFSVLDFGVRVALSKYISEHYVKGDYKKINEIVNTGLAFCFFLGIAILLLFLAFYKHIISFLNIPGELMSESFFVFKVAIAIFVLSNIFMVYHALLDGLQKMDVRNKIAIVSSVPYAIGTILFLQLGYGLRGLMINNAIVCFLTFCMSVVWSYRIFPHLNFNPLLSKKASLRLLYKFGVRTQASKVAWLVNTNTDKIWISHFLNLNLVTFYELGNRIVQTVRSLPMLLLPALMPAASAAHAEDNKRFLQKLSLQGEKYLALIVIPLGTFISINAPLILMVWLGGLAKPQSVVVIQILTFGYFFNLLFGVKTQICDGIGKPEYTMKSSILIAIMNIILSVILIMWIGFIGTLIATSFTSIIGTIYFLFMYHKNIESPRLQAYEEVYLRPVMASALAGIGIWSVNLIFQRLTHGAGRSINGVLLLGQMMLFSSIYLLVLLKSNHLNREDMCILKRILGWKNNEN